MDYEKLHGKRYPEKNICKECIYLGRYTTSGDTYDLYVHKNVHVPEETFIIVNSKEITSFFTIKDMLTASADKKEACIKACERFGDIRSFIMGE